MSPTNVAHRLAPLLRDAVALSQVVRVLTSVFGDETFMYLGAARDGEVREFSVDATRRDATVSVSHAVWPPRVPRLSGAALPQVSRVGRRRFVAVGAGRSGALCLSGHFSGVSDEHLVECANLIAAAVRHADVLERLASTSRGAHRETKALRAQLRPGRVVAHSQPMRELLTRVERAARFETNVVLEGESGVGKEVLARHLHDSSTRHAEPFVALNCAAIPATLVEATMFGHERGAFTGAHARRPGAFEQAERGTLFLDEVGELPLAAQAVLLRVLETRTVQRVGGTRETSVDVRVVAATHRELAREVTRGAFREDLYYRLATITLHVPPLRDRPTDILPLSDHLLARAASRAHQPAPHMSDDARAALLQHAWPGNVRELANVLERALVLGDDPLTARDIQRALPSSQRALRAEARTPQTFRDATREHIVRALEACGGRVYGPDGAAAALGLKPTTLQSKMKKLGVVKP